MKIWLGMVMAILAISIMVTPTGGRAENLDSYLNMDYMMLNSGIPEIQITVKIDYAKPRMLLMAGVLGFMVLRLRKTIGHHN